MNRGALSGLRVLEYSEFISGPYCGKLFADLGAEIIKVEKPGYGDRARAQGPFPQDVPHPEKSGLFLYLNSNKLGVTLNVDSPQGLGIFKELAKQSDVLVENYPPREMRRLGLDYKSLRKINPKLVVTSITPFGQTGPYRDYKGCDLICFNMSGAGYMNPWDGVEDVEKQGPLKGPYYSGDFMAGLSAAVATVTALIGRQATGLGQQVDLSEQEACASITRREFIVFTYEGLPFVRTRGGRALEQTILPCKDGYVAFVLPTDQFWAAICEIMGNPEWTKNELFKDRAGRRENWDALELMVGEWTREHTTEEVARAGRAKRIPCMPVNTMREVVSSEQLAAREFFVKVNHKEAGQLTFPGAPYKLSGTPWRIERPAPLLGEHNEEVFCKRLGYTGQDLLRMKQAGVI